MAQERDRQALERLKREKQAPELAVGVDGEGEKDISKGGKDGKWFEEHEECEE